MATNNQVQDPYAEFGGVSMDSALKTGSAQADSAVPTQVDSAVPIQVNPAAKPSGSDPYAEFGGVSTGGGQSQDLSLKGDPGMTDDEAAAMAEAIPLRNALIGMAKGLGETGYYGGRGVQWLVNKIASATPGMTKGMGEPIPAQEPEWLKAQGGVQAGGKVAEGVLEFFMGDWAAKGLGLAERLKEATGLAKMLEASPKLAHALHIGTTALRMGTVQGVQSLAHGATPGEAAIAGAETGATGGAFEGLSTVATAPGASKGVKVGARLAQTAGGGAIAIKGSKEALTPQQPGETPEQAATRQTSGAVQAVLGGAGVAESAAESGKAVAEALKTPLPTKEQAVGQVFATKGKAREANLEAMQALKESGVTLAEQNTMPKMRDALRTKIDQNQAYIDKTLGEEERVYTPDEMQERYPVQGSNDVKVMEPAKDALAMLEAHYDQSGNAEKSAKIAALSYKFKTQGLGLLELNNLAREFGSEFDNVYKKTKEQGFVVKDASQAIKVENTRQMLKRQIRDRMTDADLKSVDEQTSNLIKTDGDANAFILKLEDIENRLPQSTRWRQLTGKFGDAVSFVQGTFLQNLLKLSPKETEMNVAQMAERMPKAMRVLDKLLEAKPDDMVNQMEFLVSPREPAPKEPEGQEAPASGSQIPANLALKWDEPYLPGAGRVPRGWDTKAVMNHELGHAAVAHALGFHPIDITSSEHPEAISHTAATRMNWADLEQHRTGQLDIQKLKPRLFDVLTTVFGGAAANELYDGIPFHENNGIGADKEHAQELLKLLGVDENERDLIIGNAVNRAKSLLADPKVSDVVNEFSDTREPNLPKTHHYSAARMLEFLDRIDEARNADNETGTNERGLEHGAGGESEAAAGTERGVAAAAGLSASLGATAVSNATKLASKIGGELVGSTATGAAGKDWDIRVDEYTPDIEKKLAAMGFESRGSSVVSPKEAVESGKPYGPGWNRAHHFENAEGQKLDIWHTEPEKPQVGEKQAKIEAAAVKGHPEWTQASLERDIQRAKLILRSDIATPEEKQYVQQLLESSRELQKNPALANLYASSEDYLDNPWAQKMKDAPVYKNDPDLFNKQYGSGQEWYHGTTAAFEDFKHEGIKRGTTDWISQLGTHFTADSGVAQQFAEGLYGGEKEGGRVISAKLKIKNPKTYNLEGDLRDDALRYALKNGLVSVDDIRKSVPDFDPNDFYHEGAAIQSLPKRTQTKISNGFKEDLEKQGHDGIVYGNVVEGHFGNSAAIAFDPEQIEQVKGQEPTKQEYSDRASDFVDNTYLPEPESEGSYAQMWHVTTAKDKVMAEGLKSRRQTGSVGLGGGYANEAPGKVSVTFDEAHANQIAQRMQLAVEAAQDKVAPEKILDEMMSDIGISDDTPYEVADALGAPESTYEDWEKFDEWFKENYKQEDAYELVQKLDDAAVRIYADAEATTPFRVGFTASKNQMAKIDPNQIEILQVEARKGAKAHHVGAEAELRFNPEDLRIKK